MKDELQTVRDALALSPENTPLRLHLASLLMARGHFEEAETDLKLVMADAPGNIRARQLLAGVYFHQGKLSLAAVLLESLEGESNAGPADLLLHSRILAAEGNLKKGRETYRRATEGDATLKDRNLEKSLGLLDTEREHTSSTDRLPVTADGTDDTGGLFEAVRPDRGFDSVGGMEALKEEIRMKVIHPFKNPEIFKAYGKKSGGGILLFGPPGCGKTFLARATAGELNGTFFSIGLPQILDMWLGQSEKNLHAAFEAARAQRPSVLFFDEVDALAAKRADMKNSAGRQVIHQFLAELDDTPGKNEQVLVLGATNAPWHLDDAFKRPGRFDRMLFVPPPDEQAREAILHLHLQGKPCDPIDLKVLARKTPDFSGADLKHLVDLAVERRLTEAMKTGKILPLTTGDLTDQVKEVRPTTKEWLATARNYVLYSNTGGQYDGIKKYLGIK